MVKGRVLAPWRCYSLGLRGFQDSLEVHCRKTVLEEHLLEQSLSDSETVQGTLELFPQP